MAGIPGIRVLGQDVVDAKLLLAAPHILEHNRKLVTSMLQFVKAEVQPEMPLGPGHFGYHARDSYRIDVGSGGIKTTGKLWGAIEAYWREYGTKGRSRKLGRALGLNVGESRAAFSAGALGGGGEPARPITHKALASANKFIKFYYGGAAEWWKL